MMPKILFVGGGFGGLYAAIDLAKRLNGRAEITLLDRNDYFLFTPLLHQIVSDALQPHHISQPFEKLLPKSVRFQKSLVRGIDLDRRIVESEKDSFSYDFLVLALGSVSNDFGIESVDRYAFYYKTLPDALRLRAHLLSRFAEASEDPSKASSLLRTLVTGAGCTGVELSSEIHDWMRGPLLNDFPGIPKEAASIYLAEAMDHLLCPTDPKLTEKATRMMRSRDIQLRMGEKVQEVGPDWARLSSEEGEETIPCGTVVWTAGIKPNPIANDLSVLKDKRGRILVDETLRIPAHPEVIVAGDLAACPDPVREYAPPTAQVAVQQAPVAARNVVAMINEEEPTTFRYKNKGEVVDLGRGSALTEAFGYPFSGIPAWLLGRTIHLARLPDWGDRVSVAFEWAKRTVGLTN